LHYSLLPLALHSFPTRRSSDLRQPADAGAESQPGSCRAVLPSGSQRGPWPSWTSCPNEIRSAPDAESNPRGERLPPDSAVPNPRSEEHTSELQSRENLVCRLLL